MFWFWFWFWLNGAASAAWRVFTTSVVIAVIRAGAGSYFVGSALLAWFVGESLSLVGVVCWYAPSFSGRVPSSTHSGESSTVWVGIACNRDVLHVLFWCWFGLPGEFLRLSKRFWVVTWWK
jgi:hypothetical protein